MMKEQDNINKEKEFSSTYTLDYKKYKEFSVGYIATRKSSIIMLFVLLGLSMIYMYTKRYDIIIAVGIIFLLLLLLTKITGRNKLQYKHYKSLNNNEDLESTIKIGKEKIISTTQKGDTTSYEFNQIIGIIETKNLLILKLKYNMGIVLDKNNIVGGTKEELIDYLFSVCNNMKKKKVTKSKTWLILRKIFFVLYAIVFILSIFYFILTQNQMEQYQNLLEQNGYHIEMKESIYNSHNTKQLTIYKDNEHTWSYMYEFGTEADAKRNIEDWANLKTNNNIKDEYIIKNSRNYQKFVIDDDNKYVILIRNDNFVFYGIGHTQYKDELDNIVKMIEE